jgi:hypothetical protein
MREMMLQKKKQMRMTMSFLIPVIFYHQVLLKVMGLIIEYHLFLLIMMHLNRRKM